MERDEVIGVMEKEVVVGEMVMEEVGWEEIVQEPVVETVSHLVSMPINSHISPTLREVTVTLPSFCKDGL